MIGRRWGGLRRLVLRFRRFGFGIFDLGFGELSCSGIGFAGGLKGRREGREGNGQKPAGTDAILV